MDDRVDEKINQELNKVAQERWKQIVEGTDLANLPLTMDQFSILRVYFQLGYNQGQADLHGQYQEVFHEDVDLFEKLFEEDILN